MRQIVRFIFAIAFIYGTSISILNCTTSNVPAIYNFKLCNSQLHIDKLFSIVVANQRFLRIDELCLTAPSQVASWPQQCRLSWWAPTADEFDQEANPHSLDINCRLTKT